MPPYDEALFALDLDGTPAWRWRPREVDNDDLAFGATPNLFTIETRAAARDVVGIGGKDGTYYVIDRDGVNEVTGVGLGRPERAARAAVLAPQPRRRAASMGGIIGTPAVDEKARRVYFSTAPGDVDPPAPSAAADRARARHRHRRRSSGRPTAPGPSTRASRRPAAFRGVALRRSVLPGCLRAHRTDDDSGTQLLRLTIPGIALASAPVAIDGTLIFGGGIGVRTGDPTDIPGDSCRGCPSAATAWCVAGARRLPGPGVRRRPRQRRRRPHRLPGRHRLRVAASPR